MANKRINYTIGFNVDKQGLNTVKTELREIQSLSTKDLFKTSGINVLQGDLDKAQNAAKHLEAALEKAFNPALGTLNIQKFNEELNKGDWNAQKVKEELGKIGTTGSAAFRNVTMELMTQNKYLKQSSEFLDKMATTMANTVRWSITSGIMNSITSSIQQAYGYAKNLDISLNDIRIVTGKSADEMSRFAVEANKAAKSLGQSTKSYTDASLIYYQQGLSDKEAKARAETTLKAANVTGQSARTVSEQLTAVWNGYKVSAQEAELYVDKLAAVAATTAADLEELSTGMSKVASAANIMGVDIDQLNAQLATIVSVTREAPESIGTALKTVYARMSDIEAGVDSETTLGEYTKQMAQMGVNALDVNGKLRDQGEVIEEIGNKWNILSREQQVALAQTIAGTRQYSRMMALFDNWDMYTQAMKTSADAAGTLQKQQDIYMESTEAHLQKLNTQMEELYTTLFDTDDINGLVDGLTEVVNGLDAVIKGLGGGAGMLRNLGAIGVNVFSGQIAKGISRVTTNIKGSMDEARNYTELMKMADSFGISSDPSQQTEQDKQILSQTRKIIENKKLMSEEEYNNAINIMKSYNAQLDKNEALEREKKLYENVLKTFTDYDQGIEQQADGTLKVINDQDASLDKIIEDIKNVKNYWRDTKDIIDEVNKQIEETGRVKQLQKDQSINARQGWVTKSRKEQATLLGIAEDSDENAINAAFNKKYDRYEELIAKRLNESPDVTQTPEEKISGEEYQEYNQLKEFFANFGILEERIKGHVKKINELKAPLEKSYKELASQMELYLGSDLGLERIDEVFTPNSEHQKDLLNEYKATLAKLTPAINEHNQAIEVTDTNYRDVAKALDIAKELFGDAPTLLKRTSDGLTDLSKNMKTAKQATEGYATTADQVIKKLDLTKTIEHFVNLGGSILNLGNAVEQFKSLGSIWENEDMTAGEKFIATVSAITFGLTSASQAVKGFQDSWKWASEAIKKNNKETAENTIHKAINTKAAKDNGDAHAKSGQQVDQESRSKDRNSQSNLKNAFTKGQGFKGDKTKMFGGLKGAGWAVSIAAALAVIGTTWATVDDIYNKAEKQAKKAEKTAKELSKQYQEVKANLDEMSLSLDAYTEAQQKLSELTKGTEEYNKALQESNDQVMDLIAKYPELAKGIKTIDGALVFDEETKNAILAVERGKVNTTRIAALNASAAATQAKTSAALEQNSTKFNVNKTGAALEGAGKVAGGLALVATGIAASLLTGGAALAALPLIAAGVAPVVIESMQAGGLNEVFEDRISTDSLAKAVEAFNDGVALNDKAALEARGLTEDEIKALQENKSALVQLAQEVKTNNEILRAQRLASATERTKAAGYIGDNKDTLDYIFTDNIYQGKIDAEALAEARAMSNAELRKWYSEKYGGELGGFGFLGLGDEATFKTTDANGNITETQVSKEAIQQLIAAELSKNDDRTATADISAKIETALNEFSNSNEDQYKLGQQLLAFARKGLVISDLPMKDLEKFNTLINGDLSNFEELFSLMNTNREDIRNQENEQKAIFDTKLTELEQSLSGRVSITRDDKIFEDFSMSEVAEVLSMLNATMESFGEDNQVDDLIEILKGKGAKGSKFLQQFIKLDFAAENIETQIAELADSLNLDLDSSAIVAWVDQIQAANGIFEAADPKKIAELNRELHSLLWSLQTGSTVSIEDYKRITQFKPEWADKFNLDQNTGRYITTLSNRELNEYLNSEDYFNDRVKEYKKQIDAANNSFTTITNKTENAQAIQSALANANLSTGIISNIITEQQKRILQQSITDAAKAGFIESNELHNLLSTLNVTPIQYSTTWNGDTASLREQIEWRKKTYGSNDSGIFSKSASGVVGFNTFQNQVGKANGNAVLNDLDGDLILQLFSDYQAVSGKSIDPQIISAIKNRDIETVFTKEMYDAVDNALSYMEANAPYAFGEGGVPENLKTFISSINSLAASTNIDTAKQTYQSTREAQITSILNNEIHSVSDMHWFNEWLKTSGYTLTNEQQDILDGQLQKLQESADAYREAWESTVDPLKNINKLIEIQEKYLQDLNKALEKHQYYGEELLVNLQSQVDANVELLKLDKDRLKSANNFLNKAKNDKRVAGFSDFLFGDDNILDYATAEAALDAMERAGFITNLNPESAEYQNWLNYLNSVLAIQDQIPEIEASIVEREDFAINLYTENYLAQLERVNSELETQLGYYEQINAYQQSIIDLAQITGESYSDLNNRYSEMVNNSLSQVESGMEAIESLMQNINLSDGIEDAAEFTELQEAASTTLEAISNAYEIIGNQYQNAVEAVFDMDDSLQVMDREWERIKHNSERYLDNVNKAYQITALNHKYLDAIDSSDSLSIQNRLNEAREIEIDQLQNIAELTEYDLKLAESRLTVLQAQIALEEARENKTTMRLRMGPDGSYSYQYVADEDNIRKAEQELEKAENEQYNLIKDEYQASVEEAKSVKNEWKEAAAAATSKEDLESINAFYSEQYTKALARNNKMQMKAEEKGIDISSSWQAYLNTEYEKDNAAQEIASSLMSDFVVKETEQAKLKGYLEILTAEDGVLNILNSNLSKVSELSLPLNEIASALPVIAEALQAEKNASSFFKETLTQDAENWDANYQTWQTEHMGTKVYENNKTEVENTNDIVKRIQAARTDEEVQAILDEVNNDPTLSAYSKIFSGQSEKAIENIASLNAELSHAAAVGVTSPEAWEAFMQEWKSGKWNGIKNYASWKTPIEYLDQMYTASTYKELDLYKDKIDSLGSSFWSGVADRFYGWQKQKIIDDTADKLSQGAGVYDPDNEEVVTKKPSKSSTTVTVTPGTQQAQDNLRDIVGTDKDELRDGAEEVGEEITKQAYNNYEAEYTREDIESEIEAALSPATAFDSMFTMANEFKAFVADYTDGEEKVGSSNADEMVEEYWDDFVSAFYLDPKLAKAFEKPLTDYLQQADFLNSVLTKDNLNALLTERGLDITATDSDEIIYRAMLGKRFIDFTAFDSATEGRSDMSVIAEKLAEDKDMAKWMADLGFIDIDKYGGYNYYLEAMDDKFRQFIQDMYTTSLTDLYTLDKYGLNIEGTGNNIYDKLGVPQLLSDLSDIIDELWGTTTASITSDNSVDNSTHIGSQTNNFYFPNDTDGEKLADSIIQKTSGNTILKESHAIY